MFYTYILYSVIFDKYYIGQSSDLEKRFIRHQNGYVKSTKPFRPWELVYFESFYSRKEAVNRESVLKSWKSKVRIKDLISKNYLVDSSR
ncbi:MAG: putative endonuclease [Saprospiraceae bacterium]|jgi:putative endonuclease